MMENNNEANVKEALERLSFPSFFSSDERLAAYYLVIESGNSVQKVMAEKALEQYPIENIAEFQPQGA